MLDHLLFYYLNMGTSQFLRDFRLSYKVMKSAESHNEWQKGRKKMTMCHLKYEILYTLLGFFLLVNPRCTSDVQATFSHSYISVAIHPSGMYMPGILHAKTIICLYAKPAAIPQEISNNCSLHKVSIFVDKKWRTSYVYEFYANHNERQQREKLLQK